MSLQRLIDPFYNDFFPAAFTKDVFSLLRDSEARLASASGACNISETENTFVIDIQAPGFQKEEIQINLKDRVLSVSGIHRSEKVEKSDQESSAWKPQAHADGSETMKISEMKPEEKQLHVQEPVKYHRREISSSSFSRQISLPKNVNVESIRAKLDAGILHIQVDKVAEDARVKKVQIE